MAFPQDPLGLKAFVLVDYVWTLVSPSPYTRDPIEHKRGHAYRANAADPTEATATFQNKDGRWSTRNAEGPYYEKLPRNAPFKVTIPGGSVGLDATGAVDRATTPDTAALDITGDLDLRWEGEASWYESGAQMLIGKWGAAGNRSYHMRIQDSTLFLHITTDGTSGQVAWWGLPSQLPARAALRGTLDADNGASGYTVRLYWATSIAGPWTQFSSDIVGSGVITIFSSSAPLSVAPRQLDLVTPVRRPVRGKVYKAEVRSGIGGTVVAAPDFSAQPLGFGGLFTDSAGLPWALAVDAEITDRATRTELEVPEWPSKWSTSEADAWTPIEAAGITRRLSQGQRPLDSTLRRRIPSGSPLAYWPCEDGANATQFYSPITGVRPITTSGMQLAAEDTLAGSSALPTIQDAALLSGTVPPPATTSTQWHTEFVYKTPGTLTATARTVIQWLSTGTVRRWRLMLRTAATEIYGYDADDNAVVSQTLDLSSYPQLYGNWVRWKLFATESGGTVTWTVAWVVVGVSGASFQGTYSGTTGRISGIRSPDGGYSSDLAGTGIGHFTVLSTANSVLLNSADTGFDGETAAARIRRLCSEEGVPVSIIGDEASTQRIGPQRPAVLLDLLRAAAEADGGIFGDSPNRGVQYRTRSSLYNQAPKLTLDYAAKQVAPPLEPVEDDQVRNEWQVEREGGSSAVAPLETGPLSIADIGYYPDSKTLSLFSDDQTDHIAGWLLHLTTWNEARWPSITLRLHRHPDFIPNVLAMDVGDKIRIENLPKKFAGGGTIELLVDFWEETLLPRKWEITFNCSSAGPWDVAELAIVEDFEDTSYDISWTDAGSLPWLRTSAQAHTGTWSLRSGAIGNNQTSDAVITIPAGKTEMRFWYWTSSEASGAGFEGDRLLVLLDGVQVLRAQGTTPWTQFILDVTGASTVTLRYAKDNSASSGSDFVAVDNVSFTGRGPYRANTAGSTILDTVTNSGTSLVVATPAGPQWTTAPVQLPIDMTVSGETVRVPAISSWGTDAFGRTVSGGWGTADSGQAWGVVGGTIATDFAVGSGYGQHILTTTNASRRCGLDFFYPDVDVYVSVTTSATATGGSLYGGPVIRYNDADNLYMLRIEFTTANAILLDVRKRVAATESSLGTYTSSLTHVAGTFVRCRFQVFGSVIKAKVWALTVPEPPEWHVIVTDGSLAESVFVGCRSISAAANTNTNPQLRYDNFEVVNPQRFTSVLRSQNGVVKPQSAGASISLANPAYAAL